MTRHAMRQQIPVIKERKEDDRDEDDEDSQHKWISDRRMLSSCALLAVVVVSYHDWL
jgi:hypothetical protein